MDLLLRSVQDGTTGAGGVHSRACVARASAGVLNNALLESVRMCMRLKQRMSQE